MSHADPAARRPRAASRSSALALAAALAVASLALPAAPALGQQEQNAQQPQSAQPSEELLAAVEEFYNTAALYSFPAANLAGERVLANVGNEPEALLEAFEIVHDRRPNPMFGLDQQLLNWQSQPQISEVATQIVEVVNEGRRARATRFDFLQEQVQRLGNGNIAYNNAVANLRNSGEYAAPILLATLTDPNQAQLHGVVRRAVVALGREMVAPMLAALGADEQATKAEVMLILGDLGYPEAIPFVLEQVELHGGDQVQQAGSIALGNLGYTGGSTAALEYLGVAEQFWLNRTPIQPDDRFEGANLWRWENGNLTSTKVPAGIYDELMAMRTAGNVLSLSQSNAGNAAPQGAQDDALALWLASNYRREVELPEGETDASRPADDPNAGYYGTQAGVPYLQAVLDRVMAERNLPPESRYDNNAVALAAIRSLQDVIGQSTLDGGATPLSRAMQYPDRRVNIEAAMAIAQALPTGAVEGGEQVVPLLADALSQTGNPTVLLVMPNSDDLNTAAEALREADYEVEGVADQNAAFAQAALLPGVDVLVIDARGLGDAATNELLAAARRDGKLRGSAKLILTETNQSSFEEAKVDDPTVATSTAAGGQELASAISAARDQIGGLPLDEASATTLAGRAGELLLDIGLGSSTLTLENARQPLMAALDDERDHIRQLATRVVALLEGGEPQRALLSLGGDAAASDAVRIAAYRGLADAAKRSGNQLQEGDVDTILQAAAETESLDVRRAAAEAVGALSLPIDQARRLIIEDTAQGRGEVEAQ